MKNITTDVVSIQDYLINVRNSQPLQENFKMIKKSHIFKKFKKTLLKTRGTNLLPDRVDYLFGRVNTKLTKSHEFTINKLISSIETRVHELKEL